MFEDFGKIKITPQTINKVFWGIFILTFIRNIIEKVEVNIVGVTTIASVISYIMLAYLFGAIILLSDKAQKFRIVLVVVLISTFLLLSEWIFPNNSVYILNALPVLYLSCIPNLCLASMIKDFEDLCNQMKKNAKFFIALCWILMLLCFTGIISSEKTNYMSIAYDMMIPIVIYSFCVVNNPSIIKYIILVATYIAYFFIGCRGAFLAVLIAYLIFVFLNKNKSLKPKIFTLLAIIILIFSYSFALEMVENIFNSLGYSSRMLTKILSTKSFFISSGRDEIREAYMGYAKYNDYKMFGIFGDRYIGEITSNRESYIHNIVLEFIIDYGLTFGVLLLLLLICWGVKRFIKADKYAKSILLIFIIPTMIKLSLSNSYLIEYLFYVVIGLIIASRNYKKEDV